MALCVLAHLTTDPVYSCSAGRKQRGGGGGGVCGVCVGGGGGAI